MDGLKQHRNMTEKETGFDVIPFLDFVHTIPMFGYFLCARSKLFKVEDLTKKNWRVKI